MNNAVIEMRAAKFSSRMDARHICVLLHRYAGLSVSNRCTISKIRAGLILAPSISHLLLSISCR